MFFLLIYRNPIFSSVLVLHRNFQPYSSRQLMELEAEFCLHPYLNSERRVQLAKTTRLTERQVKIWFQNRRMKWKREKKGQNLESKTYEEEDS